MRLKHVKGAEEIIASSNYTIDNPENFKGKFNTLFNNDNDIHLEIGMGKGDFIIQMAKKYPDINFIGIEMYDSVIVRAIQKLENEDIPNLKLIRFDATYIENIFDREISMIYLNFSDPWPKNRCEKRRLTSTLFLKRYENVFKDDRHIIQKTDNRKLFEYSIMSFVDFGYKIKNMSLNLHDDDIENVETEYEKKFINMGFPIYMLEVYKTLHVK